VARQRADLALVAAGHFPSQDAAARAILAGLVRAEGAGGESPLKPGSLVPEGTTFSVTQRKRYVSRGGDKLAGALRDFSYDPSGVRALDAGASTGGFTDCLLQHGAASVAAADVGYGQLAWSLQSDPRVTVFDRTNVRTVGADEMGGPFDLVVADLSFISLSAVLPSLSQQLCQGGDLVVLVKPQFEAERGLGHGGVITDAQVHEDVLSDATESVVRAGLVVKGITYSPIAGPDGNIEFWIWAGKPTSTPPADLESGAPDGPVLSGSDLMGAIRSAVQGAHQKLRGSA